MCFGYVAVVDFDDVFQVTILQLEKIYGRSKGAQECIAQITKGHLAATKHVWCITVGCAPRSGVYSYLSLDE